MNTSTKLAIIIDNILGFPAYWLGVLWCSQAKWFNYGFRQYERYEVYLMEEIKKEAEDKQKQ